MSLLTGNPHFNDFKQTLLAEKSLKLNFVKQKRMNEGYQYHFALTVICALIEYCEARKTQNFDFSCMKAIDGLAYKTLQETVYMYFHGYGLIQP